MQSITAGAQQIATWGVGGVAIAIFTIMLIVSAVGGMATGRGLFPFLVVLACGGLVFSAPAVATTIAGWFT